MENFKMKIEHKMKVKKQKLSSNRKESRNNLTFFEWILLWNRNHRMFMSRIY